jgi:hypothetical protein
MKKTLHTPGPWLRSKSGKTFQIVAGSDGNGDPNELVATVNPIGYNCEYEPCDETKANARLIASAPDLLSAVDSCLEIMLRAIGERLPINRGTECEETDWQTAIRKAKEALRKAKGEA